MRMALVLVAALSAYAHAQTMILHTTAGDLPFSIAEVARISFAPATPVTEQSRLGGQMPLTALSLFPNPWVPHTTLQFELTRPGRTTVRVYNIAGHRVRTLLDGHLPKGPHRLRWDGRTDGGDPAPIGVYFFRVAVDGAQVVRKIVRVR